MKPYSGVCIGVNTAPAILILLRHLWTGCLLSSYCLLGHKGCCYHWSALFRLGHYCGGARACLLHFLWMWWSHYLGGKFWWCALPYLYALRGVIARLLLHMYAAHLMFPRWPTQWIWWLHVLGCPAGPALPPPAPRAGSLLNSRSTLPPYSAHCWPSARTCSMNSRRWPSRTSASIWSWSCIQSFVSCPTSQWKLQHLFWSPFPFSNLNSGGSFRRPRPMIWLRTWSIVATREVYCWNFLVGGLDF